MTAYNENHELSAYDVALQNFDDAHAAWTANVAQAQSDYVARHDDWQEQVDRMTASYEQQHAAWEQNPIDDVTGNPIPEPQPPELPPEPQPPTPSDEPQAPPALGVYDARDVDAPEVITTATGDALVVPPRVVMTDPNGNVFALSSDELAAGYTKAK